MNVLYKAINHIIFMRLFIVLFSACTGVRPMSESSRTSGADTARGTETPIVQPRSPATRRATAGATPAEIRQGEKGFSGKVDVGGYRLSLKQSGKQS